MIKRKKLKAKKFILSNITNSESSEDQLSRIFIGNLNTNQMSKKHIFTLFSTFGRIKAISMHKGYCFVQYFNKEHAKMAIDKMHGQLIGGQLIDANLVTDPKPHQKKVKLLSKSPNKNESKISFLKDESNYSRKTSTDDSISMSSEKCYEYINRKSCEIFDAETQNQDKLNIQKINESSNQNAKNSSTLLPIFSKTMVKKCRHPVKFYRQAISFDNFYSKLFEQSVSTNITSILHQPYDHINKPTKIINTDVLICGSCRSIFHDLDFFVQHKQACYFI